MPSIMEPTRSDAQPVFARSGRNDFEQIISDHRSPDETELICRKLSKSDDRIRYFRNVKAEYLKKTQLIGSFS